MPIPEFILRSLYVENSLIKKDGEFNFQLCNKFLQIQIYSLSIQFDDQIVQKDSVSVGVEKNVQILSNKISKEEPLIFSIGAVITIRVRSDKMDLRKITIESDTREVGMIEFSVRPHQNSMLEKFRSILIGKNKSKDPQAESHPVQSMDWEKLETDALKWFNGDLERPLLHVQTWGQQISEIISLNIHRKDLQKILDRQDEQLRNMHYYLDAYPKFWPNFGPGVIAAFLGSQQITAEDTAWFKPINKTILQNINKGLGNSWEIVKNATFLAVEKWSAEVSIGYPDLGGNLDIFTHKVNISLETRHLVYPDSILYKARISLEIL